MTKYVLAVLGVAVLLLSAGFAQSPTPTPTPEKSGAKPPDENYVLNLTPAGKDGEGFAVIVTSTQTFSLSRSGLTFTGALARTDAGSLRLDYGLDTNADRGGTIHTGSSVILHPGEPIQLVRNGEQFYNLRLDHYPPPDAAKPETAHPLTH